AGLLEQALALVIVAVSPEQTGTSPSFDGCGRNIKTGGDFAHGEHATCLESRVASLQTICGPNASDHSTVEALTLTGNHALAIEEICNLAFGMLVEKSVDFGNDRLGYLSQHPCRLG